MEDELTARDALIAIQAAQIAELTKLVEELRAEIAELKSRLGENSSNSSKPPSSDGYAKPTRQQRRAGQRKAGKQRGAPGSNLMQVGVHKHQSGHALRAHEATGHLTSQVTTDGGTGRPGDQ